MFAPQKRDLSHIEFEQSENISNLPQGKYIEPSEATAYRQNEIASVSTEAVLVQEKGTRSFKTLRPFAVGR